MIRKMIDVSLRPLKRKIHFFKGMNIFLAALTAAGAVCLVLAFLSLYFVIPFVQTKLLYILAGSIVLSIIVSFFLFPSRKQVMIAADSLGLKERVITAWYLREDASPVAELQRQDTKNLLMNNHLHRAYKINIPKRLYIPAVLLVAAAFSISFVPGKVYRQTQSREALINEMKAQENVLEEKVKEEAKKHPEMSEEQLKKLQEALEKLKEEFKKARTEEDALKALARLENHLEKLQSQDPLQDLKELENVLAGTQLTEELADALKNEDEKLLEEALDKLKEEMKAAENQKELAELLEKAAQNMATDSMLAQELQDMAAAAASGRASASEITQSISGMLEQAGENAQGKEGIKQAAGEIGEASGKARRAIAALDRSVAQGDSVQSGSQSGEQGNQTGSQGQGNQGSQPGDGNQGSQGQGQSQRGGAGAGEGSTGEDAGYNEGDEPGKGRAPGSRKENEYQRIYVPERLGGEGNETALSGQKLESGSSTFSEADGAPVQKGAMLPWQEVISGYREEAVQAMEQQEIPPGMRTLVRDYFSSLE